MYSLVFGKVPRSLFDLMAEDALISENHMKRKMVL